MKMLGSWEGEKVYKDLVSEQGLRWMAMGGRCKGMEQPARMWAKPQTRQSDECNNSSSR